jgi:hypothetical protein
MQKDRVTGLSVEPAGFFPYFTDPDPLLTRQSTGRDPLGMLPVWSQIGRGLVPHIASPVLQLNGIKAILLIHWLTEVPALQPLLAPKGRVRGFFRLMEGLIEYWLHKQGETVCFGSQALHAGGEEFAAEGIRPPEGCICNAEVVDEELVSLSEAIRKLLHCSPSFRSVFGNAAGGQVEVFLDWFNKEMKRKAVAHVA